MANRILLFIPCALLAGGCVTTNTRSQPFTPDWADHVRDSGMIDHRSSHKTNPEKEERLGPATITRDERGRPQVSIGGAQGLGADFEYKRGPGGRLRYKFEWDFAKPKKRE